MNVKLYGELIDRARNRGTIFYGNTGPGARGAPPRDFEEISRHEASEHRPLLSVLVVDKETGRPNSGFFKLGKQLGVVLPGETEAKFIVRQTRAVYETWEVGYDVPRPRS